MESSQMNSQKLAEHAKRVGKLAKKGKEVKELTWEGGELSQRELGNLGLGKRQGKRQCSGEFGRGFLDNGEMEYPPPPPLKQYTAS